MNPSDEYDGGWQKQHTGKSAGKTKKKKKKAAQPAEEITQEQKDAVMRKAGLAAAPLDIKPTKLQQAMDRLSAKEKKEANAGNEPEVEAEPVTYDRPNPQKKKKPKKKAAPKSKSTSSATPDAIAQAVGALKAQDIRVAMGEAQDKFPNMPAEVLKAVVEVLVAELRNVGSSKETGSDYPLSACPEDVEAVVLDAIGVAGKRHLKTIFVAYVREAIENHRRKQSSLGIQLFHQIALKYEAKDSQHELGPFLRHFILNEYIEDLPRDEVVLPVLWIINQLPKMNARISYFGMLSRLIIPLLHDIEASKNVRAAVLHGLRDVFCDEPERIGAAVSRYIQASTQQIIPVAVLKMLIFSAFSTESKLNQEQKRIAQKAYPYVRSMSISRPEYAPHALNLLRFLDEAIKRNDQAYIQQLLMSVNFAFGVSPGPSLNVLMQHYRKSPEHVLYYIRFVNRNLLPSRSRSAFCLRAPGVWIKAITMMAEHSTTCLQNGAKKEHHETMQRAVAEFMSLRKKLMVVARARAEQQASEASGSWVMLFVLVFCSVAFVLLSSHFLCRYVWANTSNGLCGALKSSGMMDLIESQYQRLDPIIHNLEGPAYAIYKRVQPYLQPVADVLYPYMVQARATLGPYVSQAYAFILPYWQQLSAAIAPVLDEAYATLAPHAKQFGVAIQHASAQALEVAQPHFEAARAAAMPVLEQALTAVTPYWEQMQVAGKDVIEQAAPFVQQVFESSVQGFNSLYNAIFKA